MEDIMYRVKLENTGCYSYNSEDRFEESCTLKTYNEAYRYCCEKHDSGFDGDMIIEDTKYDRPLYLHAYELHKEECPVCGKTVRHRDLMLTHDCHGIPYRYICPKCYHEIMDSKGYDGEYYTEAEENLDFEY